MQSKIQEIFTEDREAPSDEKVVIRWLLVSRVMDLLSGGTLTGKVATNMASNLLTEV